MFDRYSKEESKSDSKHSDHNIGMVHIGIFARPGYSMKTGCTYENFTQK